MITDCYFTTQSIVRNKDWIALRAFFLGSVRFLTFFLHELKFVCLFVFFEQKGEILSNATCANREGVTNIKRRTDDDMGCLFEILYRNEFRQRWPLWESSSRFDSIPSAPQGCNVRKTEKYYHYNGQRDKRGDAEMENK